MIRVIERTDFGTTRVGRGEVVVVIGSSGELASSYTAVFVSWVLGCCAGWVILCALGVA